MSGSLRDELARLVSAAGVMTGRGAERWAVAGVAPRAVVTPERTEQVAAVLARASAEGWSVVPAGAGTWLAAGNPPPHVDIVLRLATLAAVETYEPADLVVTAGAGIPLRALGARCGEHRQWLPLDPPGDGQGSLGATAATGSAGPQATVYGAPRDHVLGLTLVTGDGRVLELGGRVVKNVAGYDLVKLAVGSWGALGVITSLTLRLAPAPERDATAVYTDPDAYALVAVGRAVLEKPVDPAACVLLSPAVARTLPGVGAGVGTAAGSAGSAGDRWLLALRLHGNAEAVDDAVVRMEAVAGRRPESVLEAEAAASFWDTVSEVESGVTLVVRVGMLPSRAKDAMALARRIPGEARGGGGAPGDYGIVADLPAGVVRVLVRGHPSEPAPWRRWAPALAAARAEAAREGGTLIVSHGPPDLVREVGAWGDPGPALRLMRELKQRFDPAGVMNPGRFVAS